MEEIIVIYAQDPDGSVFQAVMDSLKGKGQRWSMLLPLLPPCCALGNWRSITSTAGC